jgi:predicted HTH domain antitoxin
LLGESHPHRRRRGPLVPKTIKVTVDLPDGISDLLKENAQRHAEEATVLMLWEEAALSTREAAEELGLSYADFLDLLAARGIPVERGPLNLEALEEAKRKLASDRP